MIAARSTTKVGPLIKRSIDAALKRPTGTGMFKGAMEIEDIEDELGVTLSDSQRELTNQLIKDEEDKSFISRHPLFTGITTLGLAPLANYNIIREGVANRLMNAYPDLMNTVAEDASELNDEEEYE